MHWRQSHRFLSQTPLKTRVKPQKQPLQLFYKKTFSQKFCKFHRKTSVSKSVFNRVAGQQTRTQMFPFGVYEVFRDRCLRKTASETCCFTWSVLRLAQIGTWFSLREKCPSMEFFLVGEMRSIQSECGKIRTRKNPAYGNFSRSVLYYNLQFRQPILT